ncbi:MAG TPA: phenylalanine--tRNA ligase subunit beta [Pyrinomonadaceae bacterium]|nr:phenylalanine--tRNA ligase subunit beta [Pyrinomonadaceae bacterium]
MNISYNWLKDLIHTELSAEETATALTRVGLAVEGTHPFGDDQVFDIDLTSNRPDCLSHLGIARELRVITGKEFLAKPTSREETVDVDAVPLPAILAPDVVKIDDPELCYRFTARIIRGVKIGPSPEWLVKRLEAVGERSINNVADITNYVMLDLGQPMHAFDLDKLAEKRVVVRRAKAGESITTLDEVERELDESMLMICDAEKPVAVGGVMGGLDSSITDETANVLLEVAYFDRASIRQTSRKLGLTTEASYRFERGVDIERLEDASNRAAKMIVDLAGGKTESIIDVFPNRKLRASVVSTDVTAAVKRLTGLDVERSEGDRILSSLGFESNETDGGPTSYLVPSWRHDISIEEDLVEEVARHAGYENIAEELPPAVGSGEFQPEEQRKKRLRETLCAIGFDEAITYSFIDERYDGQFESIPSINDAMTAGGPVSLRDSVIEGATRMRPTLLPGLIESLRYNLNHQRRDLKLFEIGRIFAGGGDGNLPVEREVFAAVLCGGEKLHKRVDPIRPLDFFDAKGTVELALDAIGFSSAEFRDADIRHLQRGQAASIHIDGGLIGWVGRLNDQMENRFKFRSPIFLAEFDIETVLSRNLETLPYRPLPRFPSVTRDVSFLLDGSVTFDDIRTAVIDHGAQLCRNIGFVDVFQGKGIEPGKRSLTVRLEYRSDERTLSEDEVAVVHNEILESLNSTLGITHRA